MGDARAGSLTLVAYLEPEAGEERGPVLTVRKAKNWKAALKSMGTLLDQVDTKREP